MRGEGGAMNGKSNTNKNGTHSRVPWLATPLRMRGYDSLSRGIPIQVQAEVERLALKDSLFHIWRVQKTSLIHWPKEDYGHFYDQECYIILYIKHELSPHPNIHLWVGNRASVNVYQNTIALCAELGRHLQNQAVLHREVDSAESDTFRALFPAIWYWRGAAADGYLPRAAADPPSYPARLLKIMRAGPDDPGFKLQEVAAEESSLDTSFVFLLDRGQQLDVWVGSLCINDNVMKSMSLVQTLNQCRGGRCRVQTHREIQEDGYRNTFLTFFSRRTVGWADGDDDSDDVRSLLLDAMEAKKDKAISYVCRVNLLEERPTFSRIEKIKFTINGLRELGMVTMTFADHCFLWMRSDLEEQFKPSSLVIAYDYLMGIGPSFPVTVLVEGQKHTVFDNLIQS